MMIRIVILKDGGGDQVSSVIVLLLLPETIESNWVLMLSIAIGKITPNVQVV